MIPILPKREMMLIGKAYRRIDEIIRWTDRDFYWVADTVSLWSTAMHIDHVARVNSAIFDNMLKLYFNESPDIQRKGGPNFQGWMVLTMGRIPRGKAKSPEAFIPPQDVDRAQVLASVKASKALMAKVADRAGALVSLRGRLPHPALGSFDAIQWLKFARIHMHHHLTIVETLPSSPAENDLRGNV